MALSEEFYIKVASLIAEESLCLRRKVGAVLVRDDNVLLCACNGALSVCHVCVRNRNNIKAGSCHGICNGVHAEKRLIQYATNHMIETKGATIFCTHSPCCECAATLIDAKISKLIYLNEYPDLAFMSLFEKNGIQFGQIGGK